MLLFFDLIVSNSYYYHVWFNYDVCNLANYSLPGQQVCPDDVQVHSRAGLLDKA